MNAKKVAVCAVSVALLIAVQYALGMVAGVELVTVLLLCFCCAFGAYMGMITATCFSLLRCFLYGFYPNVIVLYLIYYNLFALLFGIIGKRSVPVWLCPLLLSIIAALSAYFAIAGLPISVLYQRQATVMLWIIFAISVGIMALYIILLIKKIDVWREMASITALAVVCTICFTLLDDVISPLFYGYSLSAAKAYFMASLYVMIPQVICTFLTVFFLFKPLVTVFKKVNV